jgi:hypothetical protein
MLAPLLLIALGLLAAGSPTLAADDPWRWLQGTYWYVPADNLTAIASSPSLPSPLPVLDQTVYYIADYAGGYFWGPTAVSYTRKGASDGQAGVTCLRLVGSVTPEGRVYLNFALLPSGADSNLDSPPTIGTGTMTWQGAEWTMENQMSTVAVGSLSLSHWAYMQQCRPNQPCFFGLPGIHMSIPQFLGSCAQARENLQ